jgi:hypothetical protein
MLTIEVSDGTHVISETVTITVSDVAETSSGSGSGTGSNSSSTDEAALIDPTPNVNPEAETPEPVSEDSSPSTPIPAEDVSPEPQEPEPQVSNPRPPNPQTPSLQAPTPPPTRLGTANNSFIPGLPSAPGPNSGRVNTPAPTAALSATWPDEEMIPIEGLPAEDLRPLDDLRPLIVAEGLLQELDGMRDEIGEEVAFSQVAVGSTLTFATGLSIGYVLWLIRGGLLLSSVLSSLPAWRFVDPLPVLAHLGASAQEEEAEDDSLEAVLQKGAAMANAQRKSTSRMTVERDVDEPEGPHRT